MSPWTGRRVLITGHTGFKGSWLAEWLLHLGAEVTGYALPPSTSPSHFSWSGLAGRMTSIEGDVRDLAKLTQVFGDARPQTVFHLAAQSLVLESYTAPVDTYAINVLGTVHLLEAVRLTPGVEAVVIVTSDKCYQNQEWDWAYREDEPMGGLDPYSSSKGCAELVAAGYRASYFRQGPYVATARAGNVIGGGDWSANRLLPDLMSALEQGRPADIRNPASVRPWQHVLEPLAGYVRLAEALAADGPAHAEGWNFGPPEADAKPVRWIADRVVAAWGDSGAWTHACPANAPHEAKMLKLDSAKARARLDWRPRLTLGAAIDWTVDWRRRVCAAPAACADVTRAQIQAYEALDAE